MKKRKKRGIQSFTKAMKNECPEAKLIPHNHYGTYMASVIGYSILITRCEISRVSGSELGVRIGKELQGFIYAKQILKV